MDGVADIDIDGVGVKEGVTEIDGVELILIEGVGLTEGVTEGVALVEGVTEGVGVDDTEIDGVGVTDAKIDVTSMVTFEGLIPDTESSEVLVNSSKLLPDKLNCSKVIVVPEFTVKPEEITISSPG